MDTNFLPGTFSDKRTSKHQFNVVWLTLLLLGILILVLSFSSCKKQDSPLDISIKNVTDTIEPGRESLTFHIYTYGSYDYLNPEAVYWKIHDKEFTFGWEETGALDPLQLNTIDTITVYPDLLTKMGNIYIRTSTSENFVSPVHTPALGHDTIYLKADQDSLLLNDWTQQEAVSETDKVDVHPFFGALSGDTIAVDFTNATTGDYADAHVMNHEGDQIVADTSKADGSNTQFVMPTDGDYFLYVVFSTGKSNSGQNEYTVQWQR